MHVRGGSGEGGATAIAPGYGYEACNAQHDHTEFPEDSEFYMTFLGPLNFIDDDGNTIALVGWRAGLRCLGGGHRWVGARRGLRPPRRRSPVQAQKA